MRFLSVHLIRYLCNSVTAYKTENILTFLTLSLVFYNLSLESQVQQALWEYVRLLKSSHLFQVLRKKRLLLLMQVTAVTLWEKCLNHTLRHLQNTFPWSSLHGPGNRLRTKRSPCPGGGSSPTEKEAGNQVPSTGKGLWVMGSAKLSKKTKVYCGWHMSPWFLDSGNNLLFGEVMPQTPESDHLTKIPALQSQGWAS